MKVATWATIGQRRRGWIPIVQILQSAMAKNSAATTSIERTDFERISIVPTICTACTTVPTTAKLTKTVCPQRHTRNGKRALQKARRAAPKKARVANTPQIANGVGGRGRRHKACHTCVTVLLLQRKYPEACTAPGYDCPKQGLFVMTQISSALHP